MKKLFVTVAIAAMTVTGVVGTAAAKGNNFGSDQSKFDSVAEQNRTAKIKREASSSFNGKKAKKKKKK